MGRRLGEPTRDRLYIVAEVAGRSLNEQSPDSLAHAGVEIV
jgi:hypothetical protein